MGTGDPVHQRAQQNMLDDLKKMDINIIADMKKLFERDPSAHKQNLLLLERLLLGFTPAAEVALLDVGQLTQLTETFVRTPPSRQPPAKGGASRQQYLTERGEDFPDLYDHDSASVASEAGSTADSRQTQYATAELEARATI